MDDVNDDWDRDDAITAFDAIYADKKHRDYEFDVAGVGDCFFVDGCWYDYYYLLNHTKI